MEHPTASQAWCERQEELAELRGEAIEAAAEREHKRLKDAMIDAILTDPRRIVETPGYDYPVNYTAAYEALIYVSDETAVDICNLIGACDRADFRSANILAKALVARLASLYADRHCEGATNELMPFGPMPTFPSIRRVA